MGHREDLLAGAKRCLYEKGFARTTARDIVAASGTNLGSIGYHYGSTEALLNAAMLEVIEEWGDQIAQAMAADSDPQTPADQRLELYWRRVIESLSAHRQIWMASVESLVQAEFSPQLRRQLAAGQEQGRRGLAAMLTDTDEDALADATVRTVGSVQLALLSGVMVQWLTDPDSAPSSVDIVDGLRAIARFVQPAPE